MKRYITMTAIATVLVAGFAVADGVPLGNNDDGAYNQHKLAKTTRSANKEGNQMKRRHKVSLDAVMDFQFVKPDNATAYQKSADENYLGVLMGLSDKDVVPASATVVPTKVANLSNGNIRGDYSGDYYYDVNALLNFKVEHAITNDACVGGVIQVLTPVSSDRLGSYSVGAKNKGAHIFINLPYFKAQAGATVGAEQMLKIDPATWSAADGGVTGGWINYANLEGSYVGAVFDSDTVADSTRHRDVLHPFYVTPALYTQYISNPLTFSGEYENAAVGGDVSIAPKVAIYSNDIDGFKVGVSYAPQHGSGLNKYNFDDVYNQQSPVYKNVIGFGANYHKAFDDYEVAVAVAGEHGSPKEEVNTSTELAHYDLTAISVGGTFKYNNMITVGGEYGHLGQSGLRKEVLKDEDLKNGASSTTLTAVNPGSTYYWTVGAAYDMGPARISANYYKSSKNIYSSDASDESTMDDFNVGAHYNFSYGSKQTQLTPYAAYHHFTTKERVASSGGQETNNKGNLFMLGVKAIF